MVGLAREQVAPARAAVDQQAHAGRVAPLDLGAVGRGRARSASSASPSRPSGRRGCCRSSRAGCPPGSPPSGTRSPSPTRRAGACPARASSPSPGALPSRIARRSTGSASPSISRNTIPGTSVATLVTRAASDALHDADGVRVVVVRPEDDVERRPSRPRRSAPRRAPSRTSPPGSRPARSAEAMSEHDRVEHEHDHEAATSANGSRIAATSGGSTAFRIAISSAATTAPPKPLTWTCGTIVRGDQQRGRGDEPREDQAHRLNRRTLRRPARLLAVWRRCCPPVGVATANVRTLEAASVSEISDSPSASTCTSTAGASSAASRRNSSAGSRDGRFALCRR